MKALFKRTNQSNSTITPAGIKTGCLHFHNLPVRESNRTRSFERRFDKVHRHAEERRSLKFESHRFGFGEQLKLGDRPYHVQFYKLHNKWTLSYLSFCAGSIISENSVVSSSKCFLTNRKNLRISLSQVKMVAGTLTSMAQQPTSDNTATEQWRTIETIYSQMFYRYPAFNLCVLEIKTPWIFNTYVSNVPLATQNLNFDGVCESVSMRSTGSWSIMKSMFREQLQMMTKKDCEDIMLKSCRLFYCTVSKAKDRNRAFVETEGAGLVCHGTGDPAEDENIGVLVGVTALVYADLPTLHNRVGMFHQWILDRACLQRTDWWLMIVMVLLNVL